MVEKTYCINRSCGHARTLHSRNGCEELGCTCPVKYMDKDMFEKR